jgi:hypothetical protein
VVSSSSVIAGDAASASPAPKAKVSAPKKNDLLSGFLLMMILPVAVQSMETRMRDANGTRNLFDERAPITKRRPAKRGVDVFNEKDAGAMGMIRCIPYQRGAFAPSRIMAPARTSTSVVGCRVIRRDRT